MIKNVALVSNSQISHQSMGGGDRILIELAKVWQKQAAHVYLFGPPEADTVCRSGGLQAEYRETSDFKSSGTVKTYLLRIIKTFFWKPPAGLNLDIIYSASEALPDVALSIVLRRVYPRSIWVTGFFLKAKNPFHGEINLSTKNALQFLQQRLSLFLMKKFGASGILVLDEQDRGYLNKLGFKEVLQINGGVDWEFIRTLPRSPKSFEACFVGRFTQQKGIEELVPIWTEVREKLPLARLAVVGWAHDPAGRKFLESLKESEFKDAVSYLGFLDGVKKYKVVQSSRISIFPSFYESFGLVVLESLAVGTPVIAYDLEVLRRNFDKGVVFVPPGDQQAMARVIVDLLKDEGRRAELSQQGQTVAARFSWEAVSQKVNLFVSRLT